ncbi:MAG: alpha/beta hydrolase fold domain-containing protein [Clostridiales bacterium]|jgi:ribose/xylose/arabinose/galactoside ABC-type transport system permease subunit/acetyl esterase/lipase|nr:alpha/beta hydrolase fold domain-containing protein [Clostridiales bacterium]
MDKSMPIGKKINHFGKFLYREGTTYIIFIALLLFFGMFNSRIFSPQNIFNVVSQSTYYIIAGMGICFVMISGGIDLSVGYQMAIISSTSAILMTSYGVPLPLIILIAVCLGFAMGTLNGVLTAKLKLFPLIITLATSEVFKGIAFNITKAQTFSGMPASFRAIYTTKILGLPLDIYIVIIAVAATWFVLNKTHLGRDILAVGGNKECARLSGIDADFITMLCYGLCGAIFAIASLVMLAQQNMTSATTGPGTEFVCLTAAIIGGISMMGGKGNVAGLVVGIFIMQLIANGMQLAGWGSYQQYIVKGIILLAAVGFDVIKNKPRPRVRKKHGLHGHHDNMNGGNRIMEHGKHEHHHGKPDFNSGMPPKGFKFSGGKPPLDNMPPLVDVSFVKRSFLDVKYGNESPSQILDIFLPDEGAGPFPLLIHIHGGGFAVGDKRDGHVKKLLDSIKKGYAFASINYRLSDEAVFPAAVLDCRAAIRFLKANAEKHSIIPDRIATIGGSAGGNLSAILAMNIPEFLGEDQTSNVRFDATITAAIDWFGPTDFMVMDKQAAANGVSFTDHGESYSAESCYMGKPLGEVDPDFAAKANPMTYISEAMCPILIEHGRMDKLVPFEQSVIFAAAIKEKIGAERCEFVPLDNADHEDDEFESDANMKIVWSFIQKNIGGN